MRSCSLPKPDRMHRQPPIPQRADRLQINRRPPFSAPSLSSTTAPTGRSAVSAANCFSPSLMCVAAAIGCSPVHLRDASDPAIQPIHPRLKPLLQPRQHAIPSCQAPSPPQPPASSSHRSAIGNRHAPRIVHQHRNHVLLRLQLRHRNRRLPQQHQHQRTSSDCSSQTTPARHLRIFGAASGSRDQISHPSPAADATISSSSTHPGHAPSRTNLPLVNTGSDT